MSRGSEPRTGIALGGFMGVGKTTVGRLLADHCALPFVDTDAVLAERFGPVARQLRDEGEAAFRARERALVEEICAGGPAVVATGGGLWVDATNRTRLRARFRTVVLHAPLPVLEARVGGVDRPLWGAGVAELLASRRSSYADAEVHVDVADKTPEAVVGVVCDRLAHPLDRRLTVPLGPRSYPVWVVPDGYGGLGPALRAQGLDGPVVVVTDSEVGPRWRDAVTAALDHVGVGWRILELPAGEVHKTLETWARCLDGLLRDGFHRGTPVLALGGGVLGDIAGFAAATALRGVPWVQLPTTLLAMVDSSVGGKTAINHGTGKNRVGAFHQPRLVYAALATLATLPPAEVRAGLGEVVKTALVGDAGLLDLLEARAGALAAGDPACLVEVVTRCVAVKAAVVGADEREAGRRAVLNAGHTLAHGLERAAGYGALRHGEAVAIGLVHETAWAARNGLCEDPELPARLEALVAALGLATHAAEVDRDAVIEAMRLDKKVEGDTLSLPVPVRAGEMQLVRLPVARLSELLPEPP